MLNQPDPSYHGAVWTEAVKEMGPAAYIVKARCTLQRDLGMALSPFNTFNFIQGLETLPLRMHEHCRNAHRVADILALGSAPCAQGVGPSEMVPGAGRAMKKK